MNARQRKLHDLQGRLRQARKANQQEVVNERRREKVPPPLQGFRFTIPLLGFHFSDAARQQLFCFAP